MKILERFRETNSLKIHVLVPLILALILLLGSMALILQQSKQKVLGQELAAKTREIERLFYEYRSNEAKTLSLALSSLTLNNELTAAFKARDRKRLLELTESYFEELRSHYEITHLYFTGPDRVNILRVHQPDRYGDRIDRFTTLEAEKTGRESQGVELGPLGTFTLRVVRPWYDGESLLGYVELGQEIEHFLKELQGLLGSRVYIFIYKEFIHREGWEAGMRMLGHKEEWGHFPDSVITGESPGQIPENVVQSMAGKHVLQPVADIHMNGAYFRIIFLPLFDVGKREIGHISILLDETARISAFHRSVLLICFFYVLVGAALVVFFYVFLGRIEKKQQRREEARLEYEQGFRNVFDSANDGILLADAGTKKIFLGNNLICRMLGYGPEEIKTLNVADIHPEQNLSRVMDNFEQVQRRNSTIAEDLPVKRKDGTVFYANISAGPVTLGGKMYIAGIFRDITERMKAEDEIRKLNEELEQKVVERTSQLLDAQDELVRKEKLAMLGQVAGSVGHELRNPLGVMSNAVYFLQTVLESGDENVKEYLGIIRDEIDRSEHIVDELLAAVRTRPPDVATHGVAELVGQILRQCVVPDAVILTLDIPETLPPVQVDALQMQQVLRILISNSVEAMPEGGTLAINALENRQDSTVCLSVRDSGSGMPPEVMARLFQPLFTTKARGIGLGLVVAKNLIEANDGTILVETEVGRGTTFTVALPAGNSAGKER